MELLLLRKWLQQCPGNQEDDGLCDINYNYHNNNYIRNNHNNNRGVNNNNSR